MRVTGTTDAAGALEELFVRWRDRQDAVALAALFDQTAPTLFRIALSVTPDAATAEEAVQETFLAILEDPRACDPSRPIMPWLATVLRHKVLDARRREKRVPDPLRLEPRILPEDPVDAAERRDAVDRVRAAMDGLPEPYRSVALLRWEYGLEPGEIAHARGEPPGTVRSTLSRALEKLRGVLGGTAALLLVLGMRPPCGLDAIRRSVMSRAGAAAAAAGGVAVGGVLVSSGAAWCALAAALGLGAVLGGGSVLLLESPPDVSVKTASAAPEIVRRDAPRVVVHRATETVAAEPVAVAPVPGAAQRIDIPEMAAKLLDSLDGTWQHSFSTGTMLTLLPSESVWPILEKRWATLGGDADRQQIVKAFAFARSPRALDVIDLGHRDASEKVRAYSADFAAWYSGRDLADAAAYDAWRAESKGRPLADVFRVARRDLTGRVRAASDAEVVALAMTLQQHACFSRDMGIAPDELLDALAPRLSAAGGETMLDLFPTFIDLPAPEAWLRRSVLPVMDANPEIRGRTLVALGRCRQSWALDLIAADLDGPDAKSAATALGRLGDARAVPHLLRALAASDDASKALAIERALATFGGVRIDTARGASWWNDWWTKNRERLLAAPPAEERR